MKVLFNLAKSKLIGCKKASAFQAISVFIAVCTTSFFLTTVFILSSATFSKSSPDEAKLISSFIKEVTSFFVSGGIIIAIICAISVTVFLKMRADDEKSFYATLTSIGATVKQKIAISLIMSLIVYLIPVITSSIIGALLGKYLTGIFAHGLGLKLNQSTAWLFIAGMISFFAVLLIVICAITATKTGVSLIQQLRRHNTVETEARHSYRNSYTYRTMAVEKRIAKRSVDYYAPTYRRISLMITSIAAYPILTILFFGLISRAKIVVDINPYDGIDTSSAVLNSVTLTVTLCAVVFSVLFVLGILQVVAMTKAQTKLREATLSIYKSIGMTENGIRQVLLYEYRTVVFRSFVAIIFIAILLFSLLL